MGHDVFISHSTVDAVAAQLIRVACEDAGLGCWIAPRDITPGAVWADAITRAIVEATVVLLVHSASADASSMVLREIDVAANAHKPVLPVRIDATEPRQGMRFYLGNTHWFDAPLPLAPHLPQIVEALRALLQPARAGSETGIGADVLAGFAKRPTVAVLPFRAQTIDDEAFGDGLAEELINAISGWRNFPVIARNSSFAYRGRTMDARVIGRELGARYLVGGNLRRRGDQMRVTLDLVDVETAETLIVQSFDFATDAALSGHDQMVRALAGVLAPELLQQELARAVQRTAQEEGAYELYVRGYWYYRHFTRESVQTAETLYKAALEKEPNYARALATLSMCRNYVAISRWVADTDAAYHEALDYARRAVAADRRDPTTHFVLGVAYLNSRRLPEGIVSLGEAIRLNPSYAHALANLGHAYNFLNRPDDAVPLIELGMRLNPHDPLRFMWLPNLAASHYLARRYLQCLEICHQALDLKPDYPHAVRYIVAALGQLGRYDQAAAMLPLLRGIDGDYGRLDALCRRLFVPKAADHLMDGFRRAGFT